MGDGAGCELGAPHGERHGLEGWGLEASSASCCGHDSQGQSSSRKPALVLIPRSPLPRPQTDDTRDPTPLTLSLPALRSCWCGGQGSPVRTARPAGVGRTAGERARAQGCLLLSKFLSHADQSGVHRLLCTRHRGPGAASGPVRGPPACPAPRPSGGGASTSIGMSEDVEGPLASPSFPGFLPQRESHRSLALSGCVLLRHDA